LTPVPQRVQDARGGGVASEVDDPFASGDALGEIGGQTCRCSASEA